MDRSGSPSRRRLVHLACDSLQDLRNCLSDVLWVLCDRLPDLSILWLRTHAVFDDAVEKLLVSVLLLKLVEPCPDVADLRICLCRLYEPGAGLVELALRPKHPSDGEDDQRIVVCLLEGVKHLRLACRSRLEPYRFGP